MKEIKGKEKSIRMLLENTRFTIDYYQREYKWGTKHIQDLIQDLSEKFLDSYEDGDDRSAIQGYNNYFIGSIIICYKDNETYIIDGQQRLTTLTLLLIYLKNRLQDDKQKSKLTNLIYSDVYGKEAFNIDVEDRNDCMNALFEGKVPDETDTNESVQNIIKRYNEIEYLFPNEFDDTKLLFFSDWLIQNVYFVEITAYTDEDAYTIFETMNDRGLSLNQLDMLKGYLLACITDQDKRNKAVDIWRVWSERLRDLGKDEDTEAYKTWLRSQYARDTRKRQRGATPLDFDKIGTEFHRWVKDNSSLMGLERSDDYFNFINHDMQFYLRTFIKAKISASTLTPGLEPIYYNAKLNFTLQYALLLAPLLTQDANDVIDKKMLIVGTYIDSLINRRIWNFKSIAYSNMQYAMFNIMKDVRGKAVDELADLLAYKLESDSIDFKSNDSLYLHQQNRYAIHHLLARITDFVETESGLPSRFTDYIAEGKDRFEIEHIWANRPERHTNEFPHASDFIAYRNRIGGLLLLPKSFNSSYRDKKYADKLPHYFGQNLLAKSLHPTCYNHHPAFNNFINKDNLPFKAHPDFNKNDLDERQKLYQDLAELIWSPDRIRNMV